MVEYDKRDAAGYQNHRADHRRYELFDDGSHIIYVNGAYKGDDAIGNLVHDFACKEAKDMYYPKLAEGMKHFKEEGGRWMSCGHPLARTGVERRPKENV